MREKLKKFMSKFIAPASAFMIVSIVLFLCIGFALWSFNPKDWGGVVRGIFAVVEVYVLAKVIKE